MTPIAGELEDSFTLAGLPRVAVELGRRVAPRLRAGHPWIYRTEIEAISPDPASPALVRVTSGRGEFIGHGIYNPRSVIAVRLLTRSPDQAPDDELIRRRAKAALELRERELPGVGSPDSACRLIYAEADGLPGLIVDKLGPGIVFQSLAIAAEACLGPVMEELRRTLAPAWIVERNDAGVRTLEGLPERRGPWPSGAEAPPGLVEIAEGGLRFLISPMEGQKTGFYLDQRGNRALVRDLVRRLASSQSNEAGTRPISILDCFSYSGGFAVAAAVGLSECGVSGRLLLVDSSDAALELARANLELNGFTGQVDLRQENAFDVLRQLQRDSRRTGPGLFDLIILDPPPFARERRMLPGAMRGYKEINLRAMHLLRPGGYLVTCTCSHHVSREAFGEVLLAAAADAGVGLRVVAMTGHPPDHPVLLGHPESDYLRCTVLERQAGE